MTIEIKRVSGIELYHRYPSQQRAQRCYVELDARGDGILRAAYDGEIGNAVPMAVHLGHVLRWTIPALHADAANALLDRIAPLASRVVAGYSEHWNGNNIVGRYSEDAEDACAEIEGLCDRAGGDGEVVLVAEASEYFAAFGSYEEQALELGVSAESTDDELKQIGEREFAAAREAGAVDIIEGLDRHLRALRDRLADEAA